MSDTEHVLERTELHVLNALIAESILQVHVAVLVPHLDHTIRVLVVLFGVHGVSGTGEDDVVLEHIDLIAHAGGDHVLLTEGER